ncbi:Ankyrin repeat domain-containing protein 50 [Madurella mycetomatis]|uniref:Ankyrin repeat domain-containing protein 50 n=1 Tax=Madurella mycetomatis TaxID=100816 RepID=A0A175VPF8_9PEZI|nr:Ankyrin repeat domain-containing protein 50 [Madurella mycetomatis]
MHLEVESRFRKAGAIDAYYRFDVDRGLEEVRLNESDEDALQHISAVTQAYMNGHAEEMKRLPVSTDCFYGRREELLQIRQTLHPSRRGQKIVLLYGMGGSGKTQLALRHIYQEQACYSAIVWVDASTRDHATSSLVEAAATISSSWPPDVPSLHSGRDVKSLLRSVAVTEIIKELSGIPLAVEQAGALIREGEFTFVSFLEKYRKEYRRLMTDHPSQGLWSSDKKNRAIVTVLDMAYHSLENIDHSTLLIFIGVLGSWQIPMSFIERFQFFDPTPDESYSTPDNLKGLKIVHEPSFLRLALRRLARSCLIRLREESGRIVGFMIHRVLCQWCLENVTAHNKQEYIMQAAYGIARDICKGGPEAFVLDERSWWDAGDPVTERKYIAPFMHSLCLVQDYISSRDLDLHTGRFRAPYAIVLHQAAWAYLAQGLAENAKDYFRSSIEFETVRLSQAGLEWPEGEAALSLLCGFSRACQKSGDLSQAIEALESALPFSERLYGSESNITLAIVSRLKAASERQEIMQQHHKAVVVASAATYRDSNLPKGVQESPQRGSQHIYRKAEGQQELDLEETAEIDKTLIGAAYTGDESMVRLTLGLSNVDIDPKDKGGRTPLSWAAERGHEAVIRLLLGKGADTESKDYMGRTPFRWAVERGHEAAIQLLLEKGADIESKDNKGWTPLRWAAERGHATVIQLLLEKGADTESKDYMGRTPLSWVAERGHVAAIQLLLEKGADTESKDNRGRTPLSWAAERGNEVVIQLLLEKGADIESKDYEGRTPLTWTADRGHEVAIQLLLEKGAYLESKDYEGRTPLSWAAERGHVTAIQLLLGRGADIESKDNGGFTPLSWAAERGREAVIQLLLEKGADKSKDTRSRKMLNQAVQRYHSTITKLFG